MAIPVPGRVAEALRKSTVQVKCRSGSRGGGGSGLVIASELVITNAHVIRADRVDIESWEGTTIDASLRKMDRLRDLALLHAPGLQDVPAILGDSHQVRAGTPVLAVGNPSGFVGAVSSGIVHSTGPVPMRGAVAGLSWICADVRLGPGNSGGPLADFHGQIIGINTMIAGGLAFAIPSRSVQAFLARSNGRVSLGVTIRPVQLRTKEFGCMILELASGGPAERASLLPGDVLLGANGVRFRGLDDLQAAVDGAPGALLQLEFSRGGQNRARHVTVKLAPEPVPSAA